MLAAVSLLVVLTVVDSIACMNMAEESVSETLSLMRSLDQTGDVGDGEHGGDGVLRLHRSHQKVQSLVRNGNLRSRGIDGAGTDKSGHSEQRAVTW